MTEPTKQSPTQGHDVQEYIQNLEIDGLKGRMLRLPTNNDKQREIILMYGQHASLERMSGIAGVLRDYGNVTVPDLPGFGGMPSFYTINKDTKLDNFAHYLAEFITSQYPEGKKVTILAMSFSFLIATRMLQLHPELIPRVELLVSFVGFLHHTDFHVFTPLRWLWAGLGLTFGGRIGSIAGRYLLLNQYNIRFAYFLGAKTNPKMRDAANNEERKRRVAYELKLWEINDVRTRMETLTLMLNVDLCNATVAMPVHHISVANDFYFDNIKVEQHMRQVYTDFEDIPAQVSAHVPTVIATPEEAAPFIPARLRELLV